MAQHARLDRFHEYRHGHIDRRSFLSAAGALTAGAIETLRPSHVWAQPAAKLTHPAALDTFFPTRTVKAGPRVHVLDRAGLCPRSRVADSAPATSMDS
jgi:hypothetical protein